MSRRPRFIRHSYLPNSRQDEDNSRRSNVDENQPQNGVGRRRQNYNHNRIVDGHSDERHIQQTPKCQISVPPNEPTTAVSQGIYSVVAESDSSPTSRSSKSESRTCGRLIDQPYYEGCKLLLSLPDDVLFLILTYLQPKELCLLSCVCRQLQHLTSKDSVWIHHAKTTAVVKHVSTCRPCSAKELCRVAPNWKLGRFKEGFAVKHKQRLMPWVQKNDDGLWVSMGSNIRYFQPCSSNHLQENKDKCLHGLGEDATRFMVKKDKIVSGYRDGSVSCWDVSGTLLFNCQQVHRSDTQCVDFTDSVIISGSRDTTCKILPMQPHSGNDDLVLQSFDAGERVWSLKISPCQSFFAAGLAGCLDDPPVVMWDIESGDCLGQLSMNHRRGAGVLDLRFESSHELLTCGYDTFIRLWDLRTQTCVRQWEEPHDSALYCIDSDGSNTIVVGTARHGMVRLWDKRKEEPVQVYYSNSRNSPVYSIAMDYGHLYLALDVGLNVMDFTCRNTDTRTAGCSTTCLQDMTQRENRYSRKSFKR